MIKPGTVHKFCLLTGIITLAITLYFFHAFLDRIEPQASEAFTQEILASLDLQSFYQQLQSLEQEIRIGSQPGDAQYSTQQLQILQQDKQVLENEIRAGGEKLATTSQQRASLIGDIKTAFFIALLMLSAGLMLVIIGFIGWYFQIRVVEVPES